MVYENNIPYQLSDHQVAWLKFHPDRTAAWLVERGRDGFHIHHIDGNHSNNAPENLALIEGQDHLRLHGQTTDFQPLYLALKNKREERAMKGGKQIYYNPAGPPRSLFGEDGALKYYQSYVPNPTDKRVKKDFKKEIAAILEARRKRMAKLEADLNKPPPIRFKRRLAVIALNHGAGERL